MKDKQQTPVDDLYEKSTNIIRDIFHANGVKATILNAKGYIPDHDDQVIYQRGIFPVMPLSPTDFDIINDAIDKLWVKENSPLSNTTIHIASNEKEPHVATWLAPKAIAN